MKTTNRSLRILIVVLVILVTLLTPTAGIAAQSSEALWFVSYWDNPNLEGDPVHTESEGSIDHDWGAGSPVSDIGADEWSARWTSYVDFSPGTYRFTVTHDDGLRVYLGNKHIIVDWNERPARTNVAVVSLAGGRYPVAVDYFEHRGEAMLRVGWQRIGDPSPTAEDVTVVASSTVGSPEGGSRPIWQASYWNNIDLQGAPSLTRPENAIDYDWGTGSPDPAIGSETWSARWTGTVYFQPGIYRFTATADDGIRVWVDGILIIDAWYDSPAHTLTGERYLDQGYHDIHVEYYENTHSALVRLSWELLKPMAPGWRGEYFGNPSLGGAPLLVRDDSAISFRWGTGSPAPVMPADNFSIRWMRILDLIPGRYRFTVTSDDGARLWIDGQLVINRWDDHSEQTATAEIDWPGGRAQVRLEYYERGGLALVNLNWQRTGPAGQTGGSPMATVSAHWLNVRRGPGVSYDKVTTIARGTEVTLLGRSLDATWAHVLLPDGTLGWVSASYLDSDLKPLAFLPVAED